MLNDSVMRSVSMADVKDTVGDLKLSWTREKTGLMNSDINAQPQDYVVLDGKTVRVKKSIKLGASYDNSDGGNILSQHPLKASDSFEDNRHSEVNVAYLKKALGDAESVISRQGKELSLQARRILELEAFIVSLDLGSASASILNGGSVIRRPGSAGPRSAVSLHRSASEGTSITSAAPLGLSTVYSTSALGHNQVDVQSAAAAASSSLAPLPLSLALDGAAIENTSNTTTTTHSSKNKPQYFFASPTPGSGPSGPSGGLDADRARLSPAARSGAGAQLQLPHLERLDANNAVTTVVTAMIGDTDGSNGPNPLLPKNLGDSLAADGALSLGDISSSSSTGGAGGTAPEGGASSSTSSITRRKRQPPESLAQRLALGSSERRKLHSVSKHTGAGSGTAGAAAVGDNLAAAAAAATMPLPSTGLGLGGLIADNSTGSSVGGDYAAATLSAIPQTATAASSSSSSSSSSYLARRLLTARNHNPPLTVQASPDAAADAYAAINMPRFSPHSSAGRAPTAVAAAAAPAVSFFWKEKKALAAASGKPDVFLFIAHDNPQLGKAVATQLSAQYSSPASSSSSSSGGGGGGGGGMQCMIECKDKASPVPNTHFLLGRMVFSGDFGAIEGAEMLQPRGSGCIVVADLRAVRGDIKQLTTHHRSDIIEIDLLNLPHGFSVPIRNEMVRFNSFLLFILFLLLENLLNKLVTHLSFPM
jgi:hypothetical protein